MNRQKYFAVIGLLLHHFGTSICTKARVKIPWELSKARHVMSIRPWHSLPLC